MTESLTFALQALLVRHEAYMAEAEQSRLEMSARIESPRNRQEEVGSR